MESAMRRLVRTCASERATCCAALGIEERNTRTTDAGAERGLWDNADRKFATWFCANQSVLKSGKIVFV